MRKFVLAIPVVAIALGGTTACATKKFVRGEVTQVNDKVDTLSKSVEENQERTRTNEGGSAKSTRRRSLPISVLRKPGPRPTR